MIIVIGSDHGAFDLKEHLKAYLTAKGHEIIDLGCQNNEAVDYPYYGHAVARRVIKEQCIGIVCCGSGIGISMAANKIKGIRAAVCHNNEYAKLARQHNNANILALGGRFVTFSEAEVITETFLNTAFEGGRHQRRVDLIEPFNS